MKKRIALILMATLLLWNTFTLAEEFLFQQIPWGTNYPDVKRQTFGDDKNWYTYSEYITVADILGEDGVTIHSDHLGMSVSPDIDLSIDGYEVNHITCCFAYVPMDGILTRKDEDTALYMVAYSINTPDTEKSFEDLKKEFIASYGEPAKIREETSIFNGANTYIYWYGDNNTMICIKVKSEEGWSITPSDGDLVIIYATKNGDDWLRIADESGQS